VRALPSPHASAQQRLCVGAWRGGLLEVDWGEVDTTRRPKALAYRMGILGSPRENATRVYTGTKTMAVLVQENKI
jgi:hypothetical protein